MPLRRTSRVNRGITISQGRPALRMAPTTREAGPTTSTTGVHRSDDDADKTARETDTTAAKG
jgi:hypothetical protein